MVELQRRRTFRQYTYRGIELETLLGYTDKQLKVIFPSRQRRKMIRGGGQKKAKLLIEKLRTKKKLARDQTGVKPQPVKTHLREMIILPEMIGSIVAVYNGKTFVEVEVKADMIGHYLAEFSLPYKPVRHGKPGIGATHSSRFIPLK
eukprot:Lankesteria_metandrocarpae@DN2860_c0_g1_i2.p1